MKYERIRLLTSNGVAWLLRLGTLRGNAGSRKVRSDGSEMMENIGGYTHMTEWNITSGNYTIIRR